MSPVVEVIRTYLELRGREYLRAARTTDSGVGFVRLHEVTPADYRRLYRLVGARWQWHDRDKLSDEQLARLIQAPNISIWECRVDGETAGYFELAKRDDGSAEIVYFGLAEAFIGRGLGKVMLTRAAEEAFALGADVVRLDTCTLDSPHALPNYKARGFVPVRTMTYVQQLPD